ncbi:hypothetical protein TWF173_009877 [Orbilia oligospora]|nr:hypothetical protein TWF173_009877 [Orbilia oligospora]
MDNKTLELCDRISRSKCSHIITFIGKEADLGTPSFSFAQPPAHRRRNAAYAHGSERLEPETSVYPAGIPSIKMGWVSESGPVVFDDLYIIKIDTRIIQSQGKHKSQDQPFARRDLLNTQNFL